MLIVRELVGGLYFGAKGEREDGTWFDTCEYTRPQIERIARIAFDIAKQKGGRLTSVDKVNVMHTSRLWRDVVTHHGSRGLSRRAARPCPGRLVRDDDRDRTRSRSTSSSPRTRSATSSRTSPRPSPVGSALPPPPRSATAALASSSRCTGRRRRSQVSGIANPAAMLRSVALLLRHGLDRDDDAAALERAIDQALLVAPTPDLGGTRRRPARRRRVACARGLTYPTSPMETAHLTFFAFSFAFRR